MQATNEPFDMFPRGFCPRFRYPCLACGMSWDGHRSTKRGEDVTYRLLGLSASTCRYYMAKEALRPSRVHTWGVQAALWTKLWLCGRCQITTSTLAGMKASLYLRQVQGSLGHTLVPRWITHRSTYCSDRLSRTLPEGWRCKLWCLAISSHRVTRRSGFNVPCAADRVQWRSPLISFYTVSAFCASSRTTQMTLEKCMVSW